VTSEFVPGTATVGFLDDGHWSACFGLSYRDMLLADMVSTQRIIRPGGMELRALTGSGGIPSSRNKVAKDFLEQTDGEWLFFVDSDMGFAPDTVNKLIESADPETRPVMGGLCFQLKRRNGKHDFYAERFSIAPTLFEYVEVDNEKGFRPLMDYRELVAESGSSVLRVAGTGAACILIHRHALETVRLKYGPQWFNPITHPSADADGGPRDFSEDLSFCLRLQACGIPVHVNTAVKTCHEKGGMFLDEPMFIRQEREKREKK
jgi:hypothetical protein